MVPRVMDNNPLRPLSHAQITVFVDFEEEEVFEDRQGSFRIP